MNQEIIAGSLSDNAKIIYECRLNREVDIGSVKIIARNARRLILLTRYRTRARHTLRLKVHTDVNVICVQREC